MAKALELNADTLTVVPSVPRAAQVTAPHRRAEAAEQANAQGGAGAVAGSLARGGREGSQAGSHSARLSNRE